jgi:putative hydrolase of the HAD superfamily
MLRRPRALLFDLDATLLAGGKLPEAVAMTCQDLAAGRPGLSSDELAAANLEAFDAYWLEVESQWTLGTLSGADIGLEVWRRALTACRIEDGDLAAEANETFIAYVRQSHCLFDDAGSLLDALRGRFKLALITNGAPDSQREKLQCTDIEAVFDAVLISGELGIAKPDARIFQRALERLEVTPAEAWHIGDTLATDVAGARAAGVTAVWLNRNARQRDPSDPAPDIEISSLAELVGLLGATFSARSAP